MNLILEIAISLVVVYLLFSIVVYVLVEWVSGLLQLRGKMLRNAISDLFSDELNGISGDDLYRHPQIRGLMKDHRKLPSYIPARNVAIAFLDIMKRKTGFVTPEMERLSYHFDKQVPGMKDSDLRTILLNLSEQSSQDEATSILSGIEQWYNDYMDRVSGWYKRKIRIVVIVVSIIVTLAFNIDSIHIIKVAKADPATRARLNELANRLTSDPQITGIVSSLPVTNSGYFDSYENDNSVDETDSAYYEDEERPEYGDAPVDESTNDRLAQFQHAIEIIRDSELPIGWPLSQSHHFLLMVAGWLLSTLALIAGAPFWFDLLKKLVNLRNTGAKPQTRTP